MSINILNLGGGVQSSTVLYMSCVGELPPIDHAIFADTGWEPTAVYEHVGWLREFAEGHGVHVHVVSAGDLRADALRSQVPGIASEGHRWASMPLYTCRVWFPIEQDKAILQSAVDEFEGRETPSGLDIGEFLWLPENDTDAYKFKQASKLRKVLADLNAGKTVEQRGMVKRQCTAEYKIQPIERFIKTDILGLPSKGKWPKECVVRQWFGISSDESRRCRASQARWKSHWYPLCDRFITRLGCLLWIDKNGFPVPPRSACIGCPFHHNDEWRAMKIHRPSEFADACQFDDSIRKCGGMRGDVYLHRSFQPLRDVDLENDVDKGQMLLLDDPELIGCESGHCFI